MGSGTMVDTWATVGSCAQIGKNVHLAGGVGIGGVLEPHRLNQILLKTMHLLALVALSLKEPISAQKPFWVPTW